MHVTPEMDGKRKRAANFSPGERELLVKLIKKYKDMLSLRTSRFVREKIWLQIHSEFNSQACGYSRSLESLKLFWKNLKKRTNVEVQLRQRYVTGLNGEEAIEEEIEEEQDETPLFNRDRSRGSPSLLNTTMCPLLWPVVSCGTAATTAIITPAAANATITTPAAATANTIVTPATTNIPTPAAAASGVTTPTPATPISCCSRCPCIQELRMGQGDARGQALLAIRNLYQNEDKRKEELHTKEMKQHDVEIEIQQTKIFNLKEENRRQEELHALQILKLKKDLDN